MTQNDEGWRALGDRVTDGEGLHIVDMSKLHAEARNALPDSDFALPKERRFPINDLNHARAALAMAHHAGAKAGQVRAAVFRRYPQLKSGSTNLSTVQPGSDIDLNWAAWDKAHPWPGHAPRHRTIDLTGDGHGHHVPGTPIVFRHGWLPVKAKVPAMRVYGPGTTASKNLHVRMEHHHLEFRRSLTTEERRKAVTLSDADMQTLLANAGHRTHSSISIDRLIQVSKNARTDHDRAKAQAMIADHLAVLTELSKVLDEGEKISHRENLRETLRAKDDKFSQSKLGRGFIALRDKLIKDKSWDLAEKGKDGVKEYGKDWVKHLATALGTSMVAGAAMKLIETVSHNPDIAEGLHQLLENPAAETALAAAVGLTIAFGTKALVKVAKKARRRHVNKLRLKGDPRTIARLSKGA